MSASHDSAPVNKNTAQCADFTTVEQHNKRFGIEPIIYAAFNAIKKAMVKSMNLKQREDMLLRQIAGQWVLVPIGENVINVAKIITLNDLGAFLWKQIGEGSNTCEKLVEAVLKEYDVDSDTARADIEEFIADMQKKGLVI